jgi:hypothetical protein
VGLLFLAMLKMQNGIEELIIVEFCYSTLPIEPFPGTDVYGTVSQPKIQDFVRGGLERP